MKILHTSDWHLGRVLHGHSLLADQEQALNRLFQRLIDDGFHALLIAGDIYDRAVPPTDAVQLFDQFLNRLAEADITTVIVAGNHDSAARLGFAGKLLEPVGVHLRCDYEQALQPITIAHEDVEVDVFAVPFIETPLVREALDDDRIDSSKKAAAALLDRIRENRRDHIPTIVVAHEFVGADAEVSDSERVFIGGAHQLDSDIFRGFSYVALGHLHRPQTVTADGTVRYSGSLLPYSFSEAGDRKGPVAITINRDAEVEIQPLSLLPPRPLAVLEDTLDQLLENPAYAEHEASYVSARLTDAGFHLNLQQTLRSRFPHLLEIRQLPLEADTLEQASKARAAADTPAEVFDLFLDLFSWDDEDLAAAETIFHDVAETVRRRNNEVDA